MSRDTKERSTWNPPILPREQVARNIGLSTTVLLHYESRGLVLPVRQGDTEGYGPAEIRRLWTVLTLHRDLGVNLAGVEAILKLRAHIDQLHQCVAALADELNAALEAESDEEADGP